MTPEIEPTNREKDPLHMTATAKDTEPSHFKPLARLTDAQNARVAQIAREVVDYEASPPMQLEMKQNDLKISFDCESTEAATLLQMADIGTRDRDFHFGIVGQIAAIGSHGHSVNSEASNFLMAVVRSVEPRDALEAMLATQMGAIHAATMMLARRLNHVETLPQQDAAERALNKLARTYAMQMEALKRYRTGGQQKVTVEHVTVNAGGQAIVGAVATGGGGAK